YLSDLFSNYTHKPSRTRNGPQLTSRTGALTWEVRVPHWVTHKLLQFLLRPFLLGLSLVDTEVVFKYPYQTSNGLDTVVVFKGVPVRSYVVYLVEQRTVHPVLGVHSVVVLVCFEQIGRAHV